MIAAPMTRPAGLYRIEAFRSPHGEMAGDVPAPAARISKLLAYLPIVDFQVYLLVTVLMFAFGPWHWPVPDPPLLYGFLAACHLSLGLGYFVAVRRRRQCPPLHPHGPWRPERFLCFSVTAVLIMFLPTLWVRTAGDLDIYRGFTDPGMAYRMTRAAVSQAGGENGYAEYFRVVLSPLLCSAYPLLIVFWTRLNKPLRIMAIVAVISDALTYIAIGTNKGLADITLLAPWLILLGSRNPARFLRFRRLALAGTILLVTIVVLLSYVGTGVAGRSFGTYHAVADLGGGALISPDLDGPEGMSLDPGTWMGSHIWNTLTSYVSQVYYGLALSLEEPFVWTYGVGNSRVFTWLAEKFLPLSTNDIHDRTYIQRVGTDFGWHPEVHWHSMYPWLASDVSFWGVPVVVFLIGYLFGLSWLDSLRGNPYAVVVFSLFAIMLYYFSANNQVGQASDTAVAFWVCLAAWAKSRRPKLRPAK